MGRRDRQTDRQRQRDRDNYNLHTPHTCSVHLLTTREFQLQQPSTPTRRARTVKLTTPSKTKQQRNKQKFTNSESRVLFVFIRFYCYPDSFIGDIVHIPRATGADFCKHLYVCFLISGLKHTQPVSATGAPTSLGHTHFHYYL